MICSVCKNPLIYLMEIDATKLYFCEACNLWIKNNDRVEFDEFARKMQSIHNKMLDFIETCGGDIQIYKNYKNLIKWNGLTNFEALDDISEANKDYLIIMQGNSSKEEDNQLNSYKEKGGIVIYLLPQFRISIG